MGNLPERPDGALVGVPLVDVAGDVVTSELVTVATVDGVVEPAEDPVSAHEASTTRTVAHAIDDRRLRTGTGRWIDHVVWDAPVIIGELTLPLPFGHWAPGPVGGAELAVRAVHVSPRQHHVTGDDEADGERIVEVPPGRGLRVERPDLRRLVRELTSPDTEDHLAADPGGVCADGVAEQGAAREGGQFCDRSKITIEDAHGDAGLAGQGEEGRGDPVVTGDADDCGVGTGDDGPAVRGDVVARERGGAHEAAPDDRLTCPDRSPLWGCVVEETPAVGLGVVRRDGIAGDEEGFVAGPEHGREEARITIERDGCRWQRPPGVARRIVGGPVSELHIVELGGVRVTRVVSGNTKLLQPQVAAQRRLRCSAFPPQSAGWFDGPWTES